MIVEIILIISVFLQIVAALLALRLIRITEIRAAWVLIAMGLVLMAVGRIVDVLPFFSIAITPEIELLTEWISFFISIVMVIGVALIAPLFYAIRKSEKALRESEERYRTLVENVNAGVYRSSGDLDGRYLQVNPAMIKMFGYESLEEFMSVPINKHYRDPGGRKKFIEKIQEDGHVRNEELDLRKRDGTPMKVSVTAAGQYDEHGEIKWIDGVTEDITERKQAEEKLRESEQRLYRVIQGSPLPAFVIGKDHRVIYWNKALEELSGIPAEDILGTTQQWRAFYSNKRPCMADLLVDEALDDISTWYADKYVKSRLIDEAYEATDFFPELGENGKWLRFTAAVIRDSQGDLVAAIETLEDVTEGKQAEEALRNSELRLQSILQSSPFAAFVIGKDHRVIYWNKALEELSGIKAEEVIGTTHYWRAFYTRERPCMADLLVDQALDSIPQWYFEKYAKSRLLDEAYEATDFFPELGETGKWLRFTAAVIRDSQGKLVGAIETLEDVTERNRAEEELVRVKKLESLGLFAGGIAHDFNNMLSVMLRNIFAAKLLFTDEQEGVVEGLEIAEKVGLQAKELTHRLITFAKGGEPVRKIGSLSQLLVSSVDLSLSGSNVESDLSLPDDLWPVEMDDVQIRQVIHNLLMNAREAMPTGGVLTIRAENIKVAAANGLPLKEGKYIKWSVKDHGVGIPKENLQAIFDPYFTTKPTGSARGMGLGLAICYAIIKKHDGFITIESEPGVGSIFMIYLPAFPQEGPMDTKNREPDFRRGGKILVMNHDESVRHATEIVLNFLGYTVESAKDGDEAVDLYGRAKDINQPFSAVILDLIVPEGKGAKETIRELLMIDPEIKAILSSGYRDDPMVSEFTKYGFQTAVEVPYDLEGIREVLNDLLK
jgi:PAS domain S-box-containing protein